MAFGNAFSSCGGPMRKKLTPETEEQRNERLAKEAQKRLDDSAAADQVIDAMVKRSLKRYGP